MNTKMKVTLVVAAAIIAAFVFVIMIHDANLRLTGVTGEIVDKYYSLDSALVTFELRNGESQSTKKIVYSPEANNAQIGDWIRIVKVNGNLWKVAKQ